MRSPLRERLLRGIEVTRASQVWAADITYLPMV
jgi:hypothetical protein